MSDMVYYDAEKDVWAVICNGKKRLLSHMQKLAFNDHCERVRRAEIYFSAHRGFFPKSNWQLLTSWLERDT